MTDTSSRPVRTTFTLTAKTLTDEILTREVEAFTEAEAVQVAKVRWFVEFSHVRFVPADSVAIVRE